MASVKDFYKPKLLAAKDMKKGQVIAGTISSVTPETPKGKPNDDPKLTVEINDGQVRVSLNKTNALALAKELGDDFDEWIGKKIKITQVPTSFNQTPCMGLAIHKA